MSETYTKQDAIVRLDALIEGVKDTLDILIATRKVLNLAPEGELGYSGDELDELLTQAEEMLLL